MAIKRKAQGVARSTARIAAYDMLAAPWLPAGKEGISQKVVHADQARGHYLGLIALEPLVSTGLHQHLGVASSYFMQGSLTDYAGTAVRGQVGINLAGATHDAVAYEKCVLVARLEAPVLYPAQSGPLHRLHAGARHAAIVNPRPEVMPDLNVSVEALPWGTTTLAGVARRLIFDYRGTGTERRLVQLQLLPGARVPAHRTTALVDWFVCGGDVQAGGVAATGGSFVRLEPDSELTLSSRYGALLLAWAEGPIAWSDGKPRPDLYGF